MWCAFDSNIEIQVFSSETAASAKNLLYLLFPQNPVVCLFKILICHPVTSISASSHVHVHFGAHDSANISQIISSLCLKAMPERRTRMPQLTRTQLIACAKPLGASESVCLIL